MLASPTKAFVQEKVGEHQRSRYDTKSTYDTVATSAYYALLLSAYCHSRHSSLLAWIDIIVTARLGASNVYVLNFKSKA